MKTQTLVQIAFLFGTLLLFARAPARAQVLYGSIVGNVKDPTDAAIPGATVTITSRETNQVRTTTTNNYGLYNFSTVQRGTYFVKVEKPGFRPAEQTVTVTINTVTRADMTMQVGQVSETVEVTASAQLLQTDRADTRSEIATKTLTR